MDYSWNSLKVLYLSIFIKYFGKNKLSDKCIKPIIEANINTLTVISLGLQKLI